MSKASHNRGYPIRRPKDYTRDLLEELLEQERKERARQQKESRIHIPRAIPSSGTAFSPSNTMDGMSSGTSVAGE